MECNEEQVPNHFINFVQQEDGILGAGDLYAVDDSPGHRSYVSAARASDVTFVADAAKRNPSKT